MQKRKKTFNARLSRQGLPAKFFREKDKKVWRRQKDTQDKKVRKIRKRQKDINNMIATSGHFSTPPKFCFQGKR